MGSLEAATNVAGNNFEYLLSTLKNAYGNINSAFKVKFKQSYQSYLQNTKDNYSKTKSFFIRDKSVNLYDYYVPTELSFNDECIEEPGVNQCIRINTKIIITGTGGSGKSILLKHLFLDSLSSIRKLPIFLELRDLNNRDISIYGLILEKLLENDLSVNNRFIEKALEAGDIILFLDGFDEVYTNKRKQLITTINTLSKKYPKSTVILTSRPENILNSLHTFDTLKIKNLSLKKALKLVTLLPYDEKVKKQFKENLKAELFESHKSFLSNPLLLSIMLLTYGENANIPNKLSLFYSQAFEVLFQRHDAIKGAYNREKLSNLDIDSFSNVFSFFSLKSYDLRKFKVTLSECTQFLKNAKEFLDIEFNVDHYRLDLLNAVCLLIEDGLHYAYTHRSFQEYFVAKFICQSTSEIQKALLNKYWDNTRSDNVINLVYEINANIVESLLLIPKAEAFFKRMGIKNKIGVTHHAKIIKDSFRAVTISKHRISFHCIHSKADPFDLMQFIIHSRIPEKPIAAPEQFEKYQKYMYRKYCKHGENEISIDLTDKTYKSEIMQDIREGYGFCSLKRVELFQHELKQLKDQHSKSRQSLEKFLQS